LSGHRAAGPATAPASTSPAGPAHPSGTARPSSGEELRFSVLGALSVTVGGRELSLGPPKQRLVLAMLLCRPGAVVSVRTLTEAVWEDEPPRAARKNLQLYVCALRRILAAADGTDRILLCPGGYRLQVAEDELDSLRFAALARAGREAAADGDTRRAMQLLGQARRLWRGSPLSELSGSGPVRAEAERLSARHLAVCEDWAEAALGAGRTREVVEATGDLVERHPLRERLRAARMTALYRSGRQAEALDSYDQLRQLLAHALGLSPSPALKALYRSLLSYDGVGPPTAARGRAPVELPADPPHFTGREDTLARLLESAVADRGVTVLTGPAGVGKTAVAARAAHRLGDRFPDGRVLVRLRGPDGSARPAAAVLADLLSQVSEPEPLDDPERAAALWRARLADRAMLVVLDDAPDEARVRPLLPAAGRSGVLITARAQLAGLAPVRRFRLAPLSPEQAVDLLGGIVGDDRLRWDRQAAERIVGSCGFLPLAVEAAALKLVVLRHLPLAEFAERLADPDSVLDELAVGDLDVRAREARDWTRLAGRHAGTLRSLAALPLSVPFTAGEAAGVLGRDPDDVRRELELMIEAGAVIPPGDEVTARSAGYSLPYLTHLYARSMAQPVVPAGDGPSCRSPGRLSGRSPGPGSGSGSGPGSAPRCRHAGRGRGAQL
jgi:DNA-binding SARP family transcriptional activator